MLFLHLNFETQAANVLQKHIYIDSEVIVLQSFWRSFLFSLDIGCLYPTIFKITYFTCLSSHSILSSESFKDEKAPHSQDEPDQCCVYRSFVSLGISALWFLRK